MKCYRGNTAEIYPLCYKRNVIWPPAEMFRSVAKEMSFRPHGRNNLLMLQEKRYFVHTAGVAHSCTRVAKTNVIAATP